MPLDDARMFHVNVNCADLARSHRFYVEGLGLSEGVRTTPDAPQPGDAFGLARAQWDAWILVGTHGFDGSAIDLLEWQEPAPIGAPPAQLHQTGFQRLGIRVPDLDAALTRIGACGGSVRGEPFAHGEGDAAVRLALVSDPDGTAIEVIERGGPAPAFVAVVCDDLARACDFYAALGFRELAGFTSERDSDSPLGLPGRVVMNEVVFAAPGGGELSVILVGFDEPGAVHAPPRAAHTLGIYRAALVVPDLDAACAALGAMGVATMSAPAHMEMGPGVPALRFVCLPGPSGEVLELIEQPGS